MNRQPGCRNPITKRRYRMKKIVRAAALGCALAMLAGLLSGCTAGEEKKLHEKAASYVAELQRNRYVSDTFTLSDEKVSFSDKTASVPFKVSSETYGTSFTVWVSRDGGGVTDDYYRLYLKQEAEDKVSGLFREVLGESMPAAAVDLATSESPALSAHAAGSFEDLLRIAGDNGSVADIVSIRLRNPEQNNPEKEAVDALLLALREKGYYCTFYPYVSEAVWFEVLPNGFRINKRTGADGGAYLNRTEYVPGHGEETTSAAEK